MAWVDDHDFREDVPARASVFDGEFPLHFLLQTKLLLAYLDLFDATAIRAVCRELRDAVTDYVWSDRVPVKAIERWRACFPHATSLFYIGRSKVFFPQRLRVLVVFGAKLFKRAFRRLKALTHVTLRSCRGVTAVLPLLSRLKTLDLSYCRFHGDALRELSAVESLIVQGCKGITNADLAPLTTLRKLDISETYRLDTALLELPNLRHLCINSAPDAAAVLCWLTLDSLCACNLPDGDWALPRGLKRAILMNSPGPDRRLRALQGCESVDLSDTDYDVLAPLEGVAELKLHRASLRGLRDLRGALDVLDISYTTVHPPSTFCHLTRLGLLRAHGCTWLDAAVFEYVDRVDELEMSCVAQPAFVMRDFCRRLDVRVVRTCDCSASKFKYPQGPVVWVDRC
jgi:hypothetical protein